MEEGRELPVGWEEASGLDIFQLVTSGSRGWAQYYADDGPLFIRIGNLNHGSIEIDLSEIQCVQPPGGAEGERTRLQVNDILVSITAELGMIGLVPADLGEAYINQHVALARPADEVEPRFLAWYLASEYDGKRQLLEMKRGATKVGLGLPDIRNLLLPIAPLNEQRRIAAKLDTTLAAVDACRQRLDGVEALLKRFRQAVLAAATSGALTREWREERTDGLEWYQAKLSEICSSISDGDHQAPPKATSGIPFITISAISDACLHLERASRFVPSSYYEGLAEARRAVPGDILYSVTGTLGVPALVKTKDPFVFQRHIALLRPDRDFILPKYLYYCLLSDAIKRLCYEGATGTAQLTLPLGVLRNLSLKLPSLVEQAEILLQIENLFSLADQLESRLTAARRIVERLTPALLAKAFRGELVPQDPSDEPASLLLERIRAARQAEAVSGKPSRPRRRNSQLSITQPTALTNMLTRNDVRTNHLSAILKECGPLSAEALWSASQLEIDDFYAQLRDEEDYGFLRENRGDSPNSPRLLEPTA